MTIIPDSKYEPKIISQTMNSPVIQKQIDIAELNRLIPEYRDEAWEILIRHLGYKKASVWLKEKCEKSEEFEKEYKPVKPREIHHISKL